jgi:hypothetical protein
MRTETDPIRLWQVREDAIREGLLDGTLTINAVEIMLRELQEEYGEQDVIRDLWEFIERRKRAAKPEQPN